VCGKMVLVEGGGQGVRFGIFLSRRWSGWLLALGSEAFLLLVARGGFLLLVARGGFLLLVARGGFLLLVARPRGLAARPGPGRFLLRTLSVCALIKILDQRGSRSEKGLQHVKSTCSGGAAAAPRKQPPRKPGVRVWRCEYLVNYKKRKPSRAKWPCGRKP